MSLKAYDSWHAFAEEVAAAVIRKQAGLIIARHHALADLAVIYAKAHHRADPATWHDAVPVLIEFACDNDWLAFNDLARNYGVIESDVLALWQETRTAYGR